MTWSDPVSGQPRHRDVTQDDLDLSPIELLWALRSVSDGAATDLDDRIIGIVVDREDVRPDAELTIRYTERVEDKVTFFELSPLVTTLRTLLTTARPLRPNDLVPAAGATPVDRTADEAVSLPRARPAAVRESLADLAEDVADLLEDLRELYPAPPAAPDRSGVLRRIDELLTGYAEVVGTAARFGLLRSGWGEVVAWRRGVFTEVLAGVATTADRMARALADADAILAGYDALPKSTPDDERFPVLQKADRLLTMTPAALPDKPSKLRTTIKNHRKDFAERVDDLRKLARVNHDTLSALLREVDEELPLSDVDPAGLDLTPLQDRVVAFGRELLTRTVALQAEIGQRLAAADGALADHDQAVTAPDRLRAAMAALQALLGPDVLAVPEYALSEDLADQLRSARRASDDLVAHLSPARDFPVDDWLHGVARVRETPWRWEQVMLLSDALRGDDGLLDGRSDEPQLQPIQLPFRPDDHWLGLEFAAGTRVDEDRLLFTAVYADDSTSDNNPLCGLLFDEWTEVVPADQETTGIAIHADSPDSEPPQVMLLVSPPVRTGTWNFDDLVAAVVETFDLARTRLVEPVHLEDSAYAQLLPATLMSATRQPITISTDLAVANARWKADHD